MNLDIFLNNGLLEIVFFIVIWLILWLPMAIPLAILVKWSPWQPFSMQQKLTFVGSLYLIAPFLIWFIGKYLGLSLTNYGLLWSLDLGFDIILGLALGILGLIIVFSLEYSLDFIEFNLKNINKFLLISFPILWLGLFIGFAEELIFRGFFLTELTNDFNMCLAAIFSSLIFAILHLVWEQKQTLPQLPGLFLMGMVLVMARLVNDGYLGLAWGLHSGWIFGLSCLDAMGLIVYKNTAPEWFVGINKQPLAGLSGIICLLLTYLSLFLIKI